MLSSRSLEEPTREKGSENSVLAKEHIRLEEEGLVCIWMGIGGNWKLLYF